MSRKTKCLAAVIVVLAISLGVLLGTDVLKKDDGSSAQEQLLGLVPGVGGKGADAEDVPIVEDVEYYPYDDDCDDHSYGSGMSPGSGMGPPMGPPMGPSYDECDDSHDYYTGGIVEPVVSESSLYSYHVIDISSHSLLFHLTPSLCVCV